MRGNTSKICDETLILAADWLGERLMGRRLASNVGVEINLSSGLFRETGNHGQTCKADSKSIPREFDVHIYTKNSARSILENICHEMVHVKQLARGELRDNDTRFQKRKLWIGKEYNEEVVDYWDLPWEIEAHGRERGLYLHLMDHFDSIGV